MPTFIRFILARLGWLEHIDFVWGRLGLGPLFLGKVLPVVVAIIVALAAWANSQPLFVLILSAMVAAVLTLCASWLLLAILEKFRPQPTGATKSIKKGATPEIRMPTRSLGASIIVASIILVGGIWTIFNWPTQVQYGQTRLVFAAIPRPPILEKHQFLGFNVMWNNSGPLDVVNYRSYAKYKPSKEELTNKEINDEFDDATSRVPPKDLFSNSVPPGGIASFSTFEDQRFTDDDWKDVLSGKLNIYMFAVFKYDVSDKAKTATYV